MRTQERACQIALAHLLIELCRREVVVHHGGLEPCIRHGAQEAAALVRECGDMLLDVGRLTTAIEQGLDRGSHICDQGRDM